MTQRKTLCRRRIPNSNVGFSIKAIFWGPKKAVEPTKQELALGDFSLSGVGFEVFALLFLQFVSVSGLAV